MKIWYIHTLAPWAHERNSYRWRAIEKHCLDSGFDFQLWNLHHKGQLRQLERRNHWADVTFVCDFETADTLLRSRLDFKRMGFVAHITGAGWRRTVWVNKSLHTADKLKPDVIFLSHRVHLGRFNKIQKTFYVGLGFDPKVFYPRSDDESASRGIVFCGNLAMGRERRLDMLAKHLGRNKVAWRRGLSHAEMADFYRSGTIGWNQIGKGPQIDGVSCNLRAWEMLGCRIMLLCSWSRDIEYHLRDGKHCVFWHDDKELIEMARYYLEHERLRESIAAYGHDEAVARHTWAHRAQEYSEIIGRYL